MAEKVLGRSISFWVRRMFVAAKAGPQAAYRRLDGENTIHILLLVVVREHYEFGSWNLGSSFRHSDDVSYHFTRRCLQVLHGHRATIRCLVTLPGKPISISGSRDTTIRVSITQLLMMTSERLMAIRCGILLLDGLSIHFGVTGMQYDA